MTSFVRNALCRARAFRTSLRSRPGCGANSLLLSVLLLSGAASAPAAVLDPVTVTGAREPVALGDALQDITVIDRATIESYTGASIESLLADQAGIQVSANGGIGSVSGVLMRGANSDSTLLLIDGMRYGSAAGTPIFSNLPLDQIDHIEIVRGPMSSVYGADAGGGVIQLFTRKGHAGFQAGASATLGSEAYGALTGGVRGGDGRLDYAVSAGMQRTDGYPFTNPHAPGNYNPNNDGFRQTSGSANVGYAFLPDWSIRIQGLDARGDVQFSDGYDPTRPGLTARSRMETVSGSAVLKGKLAPDWSTTLLYGASRDDANIDVAVYGNDLGDFAMNQRSLSWQNDIVSPVGTVLAAVEQLRQGVSSNAVVFPVDHRTITSAQLGLDGHAGPHNWQGNLRSDENTQFGHQITGALAYGYDLAPQWRLGASGGTSFIAPSFDDLYYPIYSNPLLRAQHGRSEELNLRWKTPQQQLRLALYENHFRDLIVFKGILPVNVAQSRIRGSSLEYKANFGAITLGSTLDVMVPDDLTDGTLLPHRARDTWSFNADLQLAAAWSVGGNVRASGQRYDDPANVQTLGGYGLLALHARWQFARDWSLALRGDNLTGHVVEPAYGYNLPPRQWFATVRYGGL